MAIQPSVLIWTIINFCLFMLVADRLLFRPILAFMDKRREKTASLTDGGAAADEPGAEVLTDSDSVPSDTSVSDVPVADVVTGDDVEAAKSAMERALAAAESRSRKRVDACRDGIDAEQKALDSSLEAELDRLAAAFASKLVS